MTENDITPEAAAPKPSAFIRNMEIAAAIFFTALGAFVAVYSALTLQFMASYGPGPAFAPVVTGVALAVAGGWKLASVLTSERKRFLGGDFDPASLMAAGFVILLTAVAIPLMDFIGSGATLVIYTFVIMRYAQKETIVVSALVAVLLPTSMVWLFRSPLSIPLPSGLLF